MADLAIRAAGAAIGFAIGGPTGAQIGWTAASVAEGILFPTTTEGPRISDMKVKDGGYGSGIPKSYGTARINGNVIWSSDLIEKSHDSGGKGGDSYTTYTYSVNCAVGVCEGPVTCVRRIWCNGAVIYDTSTGESDKKVIPLENITIYTGAEDQAPDPLMEAALGAGNIPAHRGMVYVVFENLQLEKFGNRMPKFDFEVASNEIEDTIKRVYIDPRIFSCIYHIRQVGNEVWAFDDYENGYYDVYSAIERCTMSGEFISTVMIPDLSVYWFAGGYAMLETPTDFWLFGRRISTNDGCACKISKADPASQTYYDIPGSRSDLTLSYPTYANDGVWIKTNQTFFKIKKWSIITQSYTGEVRTGGADENATLVPQFGAFEANDGKVYYLTYIGSSTWALRSIDASSTYVTLYTTSEMVLSLLQLEAGSMYLLKQNHLTKLAMDGTVLMSIAIPPINSVVFGQPVKLAYDASRHYLYWLCYNPANSAQCQINTFDLASGELGMTVVFPDSGVLDGVYYETTEIGGAWWLGGYHDDGATYGWSIWRVQPTTCGLLSQPLSSVVSHVCSQVGFSDVDVADIDNVIVSGYVRNNQMTARAAIDTLLQAYSVDAIESDGKLKFLRKSSGTIGPLIPADQLGAGSSTGNAVDLVNLTRTQELELPVEVSVRYIDRDLEYDAGQQYARRTDVLAAGKLAIDAPVVMTASEAMWLANTVLYRAWVQRDKVKFSTSQKYGAYEPTDLVSVPFGSDNRLIRITQKVEDGVQIQWEGVSEDLSVYSQYGSAGGGLGGGTQTTPTYAAISLYVFETPVLRDQDDGLQLTVAVGPADQNAWTGGELYYAPTGTTSWVRVGTLPAPTTIGKLKTNLPAVTDPITDALDTVNTVSVEITAGTLSSVTYSQLMSGYNTAIIRHSDGTCEVLGFQTATLTGTRTYTLSNLLRRIRQNSSFSGGSIDDSFIVMSPAQAMLMPMQLTDVSAMYDFKAPQVGQAIADAPIVTATLTGMSKKPLSPIEVVGSRDASGNLTITWTRRTRIGGSWATGEDGPLGEASEAYQIDIMDGATVKRTLTATMPTVVYTASDQTTDFGSPQASVTLNAYQISAFIGRGYPAAATL